MKKLLISVLACGACFYAGFKVCQNTYDVEFLIKANDFKRELLDLDDKALELAEYLMDKHDLWDKDGSDEMCEYYDVKAKIDSLCNSQL